MKYFTLPTNESALFQLIVNDATPTNKPFFLHGYCRGVYQIWADCLKDRVPTYGSDTLISYTPGIRALSNRGVCTYTNQYLDKKEDTTAQRIRACVRVLYGANFDEVLRNVFLNLQKIAHIEGRPLPCRDMYTSKETLQEFGKIANSGDLSQLFVGLWFGRLKCTGATQIDSDEYNLTLSCDCGGEIEHSTSYINKNKIICCGGPSCFSEASFSRKSSYETAKKSALSRYTEVKKNAKILSSLTLGSMLRAGEDEVVSVRDDGSTRTYTKSSSVMLDESFKARFKEDWLFDGLDHLLSTVGWPLYSDMELHRPGHETFGDAVPYGPQSTTWYDSAKNRGLHVTNMQIVTPNGKAASLRAAVLELHPDSPEEGKAAYNRLKTQVHRAKERAREEDKALDGIEQQCYDKYRKALP